VAYLRHGAALIYHGSRLLEGSKRFVDWLKAQDKRYLFLTNSSARSPRELHQRLSHMGIEVGEDHFITSAMATAISLRPNVPRAVYAIATPDSTRRCTRQASPSMRASPTTLSSRDPQLQLREARNRDPTGARRRQTDWDQS